MPGDTHSCPTFAPDPAVPLIAHLSDLHLGLTRYQARTAARQNQREADMQAALDVAVDHLLDVKPDLVVIAGDTLHKYHVGTAAELGAVHSLRRLVDAGIPVNIIGGNHDQPHSSGSAISLGHLAERGMGVHLDQAQVDVAGVRLHLVPYRALARFYGGAGTLQDFDFSETMPNVLVAHGYAAGDGVTYPPEPVQIPADWLEDPRFALCCLGHVHIHQQIAARAFYAGVLERTSIDESDVQPGFYLHTVQDGRLTRSDSVFIADLGFPGVPRPMLRLTIDGADRTLDELNQEVVPLLSDPRMAGSIVELTVNDVSAEFSRRRLRHEWERLHHKAGGLHLDVVARSRRVTELLDVEFASLPTNISDAFEVYLAEQKYADARERVDLLELGMELLTIGHDQVAREAVK